MLVDPFCCISPFQSDFFFFLFLMEKDAKVRKMECYVMHLSIWRAAIYCSTLWVPLPRPAHFLSLSQMVSPDLVLLPVWLEYCRTRRSRGQAIQPIKATKLKRVKPSKKDREKRAGWGEGDPQCATIHSRPEHCAQMHDVLFFVDNKSNSTSFQGGPTIFHGY